MKSNSYTNIRKSERRFSDVGRYNNRFPNVSVGIEFSNQKSCFLSFFTNPYIQNHFKVNVFVTC